jgi:hypothetical protein
MVDTQLNISGKVAQFGRGALADVSDKLLLQFVDNLNKLIASQPLGSTPSAPSAVATPHATPTPAIAPAHATAPDPAVADRTVSATPSVRKIEQTQEVAPLNLLDTAGSTIAKRLVPVVLVIAAVVAAFVVFR